MNSGKKTDSSLVVSLGAGLISVLAVVVLSSKYGIGVSPDSACYISIAQNILAGNGYAIYDLEPAVAWPPLYSTILALAGLLHVDYLTWALYFNALLFGAVTFVSSRWLFSEISWRPLVWIGIVGIILSPSLILVGRFAWTEMPFILLMILFLFSMLRTGFDPQFKDILLMALIAALACLTRYIGVTLIGGYLLWLLFCRLDFKRRLLYGAFFAVVSVAPLAIWLARNYMVTSTLAGPRSSSLASFFKNVYYTADTLSIWLMPIQIPADTRLVVLGCLFVIILISLLRVMFEVKFTAKPSKGILLLAGYSAIYTGFLIVVSSLVAFDRIDLRLLSPIYILLLLTVIVLADYLVKHSKRWRKKLKIALMVVSVLWLGHLTNNAYSELSFCLREGAGGYSSLVWKESQLADYLLANPPSGKLFSNIPDGIYALTRQSASMAPRSDLYHPPDAPTDDVLQFEKLLQQENSVLLAWFTNTNRGWMYEPKELSLYFKLDTVKTLRDGTLYRITSRFESAP